MPALWWVELVLLPLMGRAVSGVVFWGVCEVSTALGGLSADGCVCVPVSLVWHEVWQVGGAGSWI